MPKTPNHSTGAEPWAVFLVGFMGAGKTTVGKALASRLGWRFVDLDNQIESHEGRSVAEIFRRAGEVEFRRAEAEALGSTIEQLDSEHPAIVALGGGAFAQEMIRKLISGIAQPTVFLDGTADDLMARCRHEGTERPLMGDENHFRQLYERRRPAYMEADICIQTVGKSPASVVGEIVAALSLHSKERLA
jgi:shikimate kinase